MYKVLFGKINSTNGTYGQTSGTELSFRPSRLRDDVYGVPKTTVESRNQQLPDDRSERSDGSREPVIYKTTEFQMEDSKIKMSK
jgi:hypothetical protein